MIDDKTKQTIHALADKGKSVPKIQRYLRDEDPPVKVSKTTIRRILNPDKRRLENAAVRRARLFNKCRVEVAYAETYDPEIKETLSSQRKFAVCFPTDAHGPLSWLINQAWIPRVDFAVDCGGGFDPHILEIMERCRTRVVTLEELL